MKERVFGGFKSKADMDKYIASGKWPGARSHAGCVFVEQIIRGKGVDVATEELLARFDNRTKQKSSNRSA